MARKIIIKNEEYEIEDEEYEKLFSDRGMASFPYRDEIKGEAPTTFLERFFGFG